MRKNSIVRYFIVNIWNTIRIWNWAIFSKSCPTQDSSCLCWPFLALYQKNYRIFNKDFKRTVAFVWRSRALSFMKNAC